MSTQCGHRHGNCISDWAGVNEKQSDVVNGAMEIHEW